MSKPRVWHECVQSFEPLGKGKVLDVSEGVNGEDRLTFKCALCGKVHENATALR